MAVLNTSKTTYFARQIECVLIKRVEEHKEIIRK